MTREDILAALGDFFAREPRALAVYLFGSEARGDRRAGSDVDVAVLLDGPSPTTLDDPPLAWRPELERLLGRDVDVVALGDAPPDLVHRVLRDGVLVLERDRGARIRFEVRARNEYFDVLPFLQRYRRSAGAR